MEADRWGQVEAGEAVEGAEGGAVPGAAEFRDGSGAWGKSISAIEKVEPVKVPVEEFLVENQVGFGGLKQP
jgi:hypothetical protein